MKYRAKYLPTALIAFAGGTYTMVSIIGAVLNTLESWSNPTMIFAVFVCMVTTPLLYAASGYYFHKWLEWRKPTRRDMKTFLEGAKTGWRDRERVRGTATHPHPYVDASDSAHDDSGRTQITSMGE